MSSVFTEEDPMINLLAIDKVLGFWIEHHSDLKESATALKIAQNPLILT